jgi:hypothetical protein
LTYEPIVGGKFGRNDDFSDESVVYWISSNKKDLDSILKILKEEKYKLYLTFSVVYGEDGDLKQSHNGEIIERMSDLYPELEIDTFNPWDIN